MQNRPEGRKSRWRIFAGCLLVLVCLIALAVPLYNRESPRLFGVSFFVWFQFVWIIVAALCTGLAYRLRRG